MKIVIRLCIFLILPLPFVFLGVGNFFLPIRGLGVDTDGRLYIGHPSGQNFSKVDVVESGEIVKVLKLPYYRSYYFTMDDKDQLLVTTGSDIMARVHIVDTSGKMVMEYENLNAYERANNIDNVSSDNWVYKTRHRQIQGDALYELKYRWARYYVTRTVGDETIEVYRMPTDIYLLSFFLSFMIVELAIASVILGIRDLIRRERKQSRQ